MSTLGTIIANDGTVTVYIVGDQQPYVIPPTHINYADILNAINREDAESVRTLANVQRSVEQFAAGSIKVRADQVFYNDQLLNHVAANEMLRLMRAGLPFRPLGCFLDKLMLNPAASSVKELWDFLRVHGMPLTPDGDFLAHKRVKDDWTDFYSGTIDNSIGQVVRVPRNMVDDNRHQDCSFGLHVGNLEYVRSFNDGGHIIVCKVNPKDAVSVPVDHNCTKLRVCEYTVIGEFTGNLSDPLYTSLGKPVTNLSDLVKEEEEDYDDEEEDYEEDYDDEEEDYEEDYDDEEEDYEEEQDGEDEAEGAATPELSESPAETPPDNVGESETDVTRPNPCILPPWVRLTW